MKNHKNISENKHKNNIFEGKLNKCKKVKILSGKKVGETNILNGFVVLQMQTAGKYLSGKMIPEKLIKLSILKKRGEKKGTIYVLICRNLATRVHCSRKS